jgi:hypothetical protein
MYPALPFSGLLRLANSVLFFLTFLFGRFVFQLRLAWVFFSWLHQQEYQLKYTQIYGSFERFLFWFAIACQFAMIVLNTYWLMLIFKQIKRNMSKKGGEKDIVEEISQ